VKSEARHFEDYLKLARKLVPGADLEGRLAALRTVEQSLVEAPDPLFRFHSGPPLAEVG
jgi:tRNA-(ms[2]io[6]A)-hydroxylase